MTTETSPLRPSQCTAAVSLSEDGEPHPYLTLFYSVQEGRITFFALEVAGTETVETPEGEDPSERILYNAEDGSSTTNPDDASVLVSGALYKGGMTLDTFEDSHYLESLDQATNYVSAIRMVYNMEAQGV